jgi:hypothetical protein
MEGSVEKWSVHEDDRPYLRPARPFNPWVAVALIGIVAWIAALAYRHLLDQPAPAPLPPAAAPQLEAPVATAPAPEPAVRHPIDTPAESVASLPTLENSDSMMRDALSALMGNKAFGEMVVPSQLVRRIVATVDNLPRATAPTRVLPLNAVPGKFAVLGADAEGSVDSMNFERYLPYVRVFEMIQAHALVQGYARAYPLFQRAYEELGYPGKYFNDRLMQAIDDLLAAPEVDRPLRVIRSKVLYEFADPDLETRSAGQKIMMRMGPDNQARVKAKLWDIRRELVAASKRP